MPFSVPTQFSLNELITAAKFTTIRDSLLAFRDALRAFEYSGLSPEPYSFRLRTGLCSALPVSVTVTSTTNEKYLDANSFVSSGQRLALWATLFDATAGSVLSGSGSLWITTRPGSGTTNVSLYSSGGVIVQMHVGSDGLVGFSRTGTTAPIGITGHLWGGY